MNLDELLSRVDIPADVVTILRDEIAAREHAASALRLSERRYRSLFENSPMGIFVYGLENDRDLILLDSNPAASAILGADCQQLVGKTIEDAFPLLSETEVPDAYRRVARTGESWHNDQVLYSDGRIDGTFDVHAFRAAPERVAVMFSDVTERNAAAEQQRKAREREALHSERLRAVVDIANELLACEDEDTVFRTCVERARERLGVERCAIFLTDGDIMRGTYGTDADGQTTDEHGASFERRERWGEALAAAADIRTPRWVVQEANHSYFTGSERVLLGEGWVAYTPIQTYGCAPIGVMVNDTAISGRPVEDDLQEIVTVLCSLLCNVVERRRIEESQRALEAQILHSQKHESLGVLAGGIAHDFNNILMGVLGNASLALAQLSPVSPARQCIERVEASALRAADLAKQMLAYSGKGRFIVQTVDLADVIDEMTHLLEASISERAVLRRDLIRGEACVDGDVTQLRQVLLNLVSNASDALGDDGGVITLRTGRARMDEAYLASTFVDDHLPAGDYAYVEVSDTGCGMDEATKARLFDPFFSTKRVGRGLGMPAVLGIARGHQGAIKVYSEPSRGTTVRVFIPVSSEPQDSLDEEAAAPVSAMWSAEGDVLVVDDEEAVRQVAAMTLAMVGLTTVQAANGEEALMLFEQKRQSVVAVLLDMSMPVMSGEEVFHELRRRGADVPVLLSSGFNEQDSTNCLAGRGIAGFIQKPYRPMELLDRLRTLLGR